MVLVEGGRIAAVDRSGAAPPPHADVVELGDATLLPGLVDAHVHLTFRPSGHPLDDVVGVDDEVLLARMQSHAASALAAGITTVRDLRDTRYLTRRLRDGGTRGRELLMAGPPITRRGGHCWFLGGEADGVDGVRAVAQRAAAGVGGGEHRGHAAQPVSMSSRLNVRRRGSSRGGSGGVSHGVM